MWDDRYIKDASRTPRLITTQRWRRKVMSDPPTTPLVPRFGISHMPSIRTKALSRTKVSCAVFLPPRVRQSWS
jgi:hypothetical protein